MENQKKYLLRKVLIEGNINVYTYEQIKKNIFELCQMSTSNTTDRVKWSNWINGRTLPSKEIRGQINLALTNNNLTPIYDQTFDN